MNVYGVMKLLDFKGYSISCGWNEKDIFYLVDSERRITCVFDVDTGEVIRLSFQGHPIESLDSLATMLMKPVDETISITVDDDMKIALLELSFKHDLSPNSMVVKLVKDHLIEKNE